MKYQSTKTIQSEACDGVSFTVRKVTVRRRAELEDKQSKYRERLRALHDERDPLSEEYGATPAGFPTDKLKRLYELTQQIQRIDRDEMTPEAVRHCLVSIDGLTVDDQPATLDLVLANGPDELYEEIARAVASELGLLPDERKNSQSPSTLDGAEGGKTGSAVPVETPDTTTVAGAESTTVQESVTVPSTPLVA